VSARLNDFGRCTDRSAWRAAPQRTCAARAWARTGLPEPDDVDAFLAAADSDMDDTRETELVYCAAQAAAAWRHGRMSEVWKHALAAAWCDGGPAAYCREVSAQAKEGSCP